MRLFRKGKICIIAKFHWTDLVICSHSRERKTLTYSRRNNLQPEKYGKVVIDSDKESIETNDDQQVHTKAGITDDNDKDEADPDAEK